MDNLAEYTTYLSRRTGQQLTTDQVIEYLLLRKNTLEDEDLIFCVTNGHITHWKKTFQNDAGTVMRNSVARDLAICVLQTRPLPGASGRDTPFMEVAMAAGEDGRPGFSADSSLVEIANAISKMLI